VGVAGDCVPEVAHEPRRLRPNLALQDRSWRGRGFLLITSAQIRAARALLGWRQADLAEASGISEVAIKNIERGQADPKATTLTAIQKAFQKAGVIFLDPQDIRDGGHGVRFKK
jgi:DNA-binding XRE family transcriptional regulator